MDIEAVLSSQFSRRKEYWLLACFASLSGITAVKEERAVEEGRDVCLVCANVASFDWAQEDNKGTGNLQRRTDN
jgi:hypothetical protein